MSRMIQIICTSITALITDIFKFILRKFLLKCYDFMKTRIGDSKFETLVLEVIKEDNMSEFVKAVSSFQYAYMHFSNKSYSAGSFR